MRIFCDMHHAGLAYSLHLLLEKRLGHELYFPIGEEWADQGYWLIHKPYNYAHDTVKQYLSLDQRYTPIDGTLPLNRINSIKPTHYEILDLAHGYTMKSITLAQFQSMDIDIIIASIPDHAVSFKRLRDRLKPKAKLIFQMGNMFHEIETLVREGQISNLLASTIEVSLPVKVNTLYYHQEIPLRPFTPPPYAPKVVSLVHLLPQPEVYNRFKEALAPIEFRSYGALCPDGYKNTLEEVYQTISSASVVFHNKPYGDGFGWVVHSAIMLGRPLVVNYRDYQKQLAGELLGDNYIDTDDPHAIEKLRDLLTNRDRLMDACMYSYNIFRTKIDYNKEADRVSTFLSRLH